MSGEGAWVKILRFNAVSRNINTIILKIFCNHGGIYKFERKSSKYSGERLSSMEFMQIWKDVSLWLVLKEKSGNQHSLPFVWFWPRNWNILGNEWAKEKGYFEIEDWGISADLYWGFKKISWKVCLLSYCFLLIKNNNF